MLSDISVVQEPIHNSLHFIYTSVTAYSGSGSSSGSGSGSGSGWGFTSVGETTSEMKETR